MNDNVESHTQTPDFMKLKSELTNNENGVLLFEDKHFPAKYSILFHDSNEEYGKEDIIWRRPNQLSKEPCLLSNFEPDVPIKLYHGKLTPFWFPVVVHLLKENDMIDLVVPNHFSQNSFNQDASVITPSSMTYCGAFQFSFRRGGVLENVIIDDLLPTTESCHLLTTMTSNADEFLPALIEKAYAKFLGGYYKIEKESFFGALMDFTGGLAESISKEIDESLSLDEINSLFQRISNMVGSSFAVCEVDQLPKENYINGSIAEQCLFYKINGFTELPKEAPDGIITDLVNTISMSRGDIVPAVRILPLGLSEENCFIDKHVLHDWQNATLLVKKKYGLEFDSNKENWIYLEDVLKLSERVVILNMFYRSSIVALAKKQPYWKYTFFENFWNKDIRKGNLEKLGDDFLKNNQYLLTYEGDEPCSVKIMLTNIQKFVDVGPNQIQLGSNAEIGVTILEVEKNRRYRVHDVFHTEEHVTHVDFQMGRYLVISANLETGHYVIIPWISEGAGIKYTMQIFSSSSEAEITSLDLDIPRKVLCNPCQIKRAAFHTPNKNKSLSHNNDASKSSRKASTAQTDLCQVCRSLYPKRATRISVIGAQDIILTAAYQLPNFFFKILCEDEIYTSKTVRSSLSPQWNEHFLFYRVSDSNSQASIQLFCETKLGFKSTLFVHSFSEKELRDKCRITIPIVESMESHNQSESNILFVDVQNYFLSEFNLA